MTCKCRWPAISVALWLTGVACARTTFAPHGRKRGRHERNYWRDDQCRRNDDGRMQPARWWVPSRFIDPTGFRPRPLARPGSRNGRSCCVRCVPGAPRMSAAPPGPTSGRAAAVGSIESAMSQPEECPKMDRSGQILDDRLSVVRLHDDEQMPARHLRSRPDPACGCEPRPPG